MTDTGKLEKRVIDAAEAFLEHTGTVSAFDVLMRLGWLYEGHVKMWRQQYEHFRFIEQCMQSTAERRRQLLDHFEQWGRDQGLEAAAAAFFPNSRDNAAELQVTAGGDTELERLYRLSFIKPDLSEKKREAIKKKATKRPDILVFVSFREDKCSECGAEIDEGDLVYLSGPDVLCLTCADLDRLVFLASGDVAMTRRARKHSPISAVVLKHNRRAHRQQRIGLLVTEKALELAEEECLADEDARARQRQRAEERRQQQDLEFAEQMAAEIKHLYPGCPQKEAKAIAEHTCQRGSGRVGRAAFGRELHPKAIELAVRAHIRHEHTPYDILLYTIGDRDSARRRIADAVETIIEKWKK